MYQNARRMIYQPPPGGSKPNISEPVSVSLTKAGENRMFGAEMGQSGQIAFVLKARVKDQEVTPGTISLALFNEFNAEVEKFLAGSQRRSPGHEVRFDIESGSYKLVLTLPTPLFASVRTDLQRLGREDALGEIDPKRAEIITQWQERAQSMPGYGVDITSPGGAFRPVRITRATEYRTPNDDHWVNVERYIVGTVVDMGGLTTANVHVQDDATGRQIVAASSEEYLREQKENVLYRKVQIHVTAQENIKTGKLRGVRLISFVGNAPSYDEMELETAIEKGSKAWAGIPNAASWVRDLRGGEDE